MKSKISTISLIFISLLSACVSPINNTQNSVKTTFSEFNLNTSLSGIAEFPKANSKVFSSKATLSDIEQNATVSLIYQPDHPSFPNKTVATGLTDAKGAFTINFDNSFPLNIKDIFILEATKRLGSSGNSLMSVRTYVKWNGSAWESITTPKINLNSSTTALTAMVGLMSTSISPSDTFGTIGVSSGSITPSDIKKDTKVIIRGESIASTAKLVDYTLLNNYDPIQYLTYQNGKFFLKEPTKFLNTITTVAGNGIGDNLLASNAKLYNPTNITFDNNGNMYIADTYNHRVRKIDKNTGIINTFAGNGNPQTDKLPLNNEDANNTTVSYPKNIIFDKNGNMYISGSISISKVDTNGVITTIAGGGSNSEDGVKATTAYLFSPQGIAFDKDENLYIVSSLNNKVRRVDKITNVITTVAGGGNSYSEQIKATNAQLLSPTGITFDSLGNLYIADSGNNMIRKVDNNGIISTIAGRFSSSFSGDNGKAVSAYLNKPTGVEFDLIGNMYISDSGNNRIRKVDNNGIISTIAGIGVAGYSGDNANVSNAELNNPTNITFDSLGNMYISDSGNNRIRKVDNNGIITTISGAIVDNIISTNSVLNEPRNLTFDSLGNMYIVDTLNHRIRKVDTNGIITTVAGNGLAGFSGDTGNAINAKLNNPTNITFDSLGNIYIVDALNNRIRKVDTNGIITTVVGTGAAGYSGDDGKATNAKLNNPRNLTFDSLGNMYISDSGNNRVRKVNTNGIITTIIGTNSYGYSGDNGKATNAQLDNPTDIVFDTNGNLYIADSGNHRIRKIDTNGLVYTVIGNGVAGFIGDEGKFSNAQLNFPTGVTFDSLGNMYIADSRNNRIRKVLFTSGI